MSIKSIVFILFVVFSHSATIAQNKISEQIAQYDQKSIHQYNVLTIAKNARSLDLDKIKQAHSYNVDLALVHELKINQHDLIEIPLHRNNSSLKLTLFEVDVFSDAYFLESSDGLIDKKGKERNKFYHGIVKGDDNSLVALSVLGDQVKIFIADDSGNFEVNRTVEGQYLGYYQHAVEDEREFECELFDKPGYKPNFNVPTGSTKSTGGCIEVYFECDHESYQDNGNSLSNTEAWAASIFNEVMLLYANESIPIVLSQTLVWTTTDPYAGISGIGSVLTEFGKIRKNNYTGRLAHLLSTRNMGGGVAWLDVLCDVYHSNGHWGPYAVSASLTTSVTSFPSYSWNINVVSHEMGHNIGSQHTHACVWGPNNNQQIDDCGPVYFNLNPQPTCYNAGSPILPSNGGTVMSYCHGGSVGINLNNGFGTEPGALILSRFNTASCATGSNCTPTAPSIVCPNDFISSYNTCNSIDYDPFNTGTATATGGSGNVTVTYSDNFVVNNSCRVIIDRTWLATDATGATDDCVQLIDLNENIGPTFSNCPQNLVVPANDNCMGKGNWQAITASDNCSSFPNITSSHQAGSFFPLGVTTVVVTATDNCNNSSTCSFTIEVVDNLPPEVVDCPNDIIVQSNNNCTAIVSWTAPTYQDNCNATTSSTHTPGSTFNLGLTQVTYTFTDDGGNVSQCMFNVEVLDNCSNVNISCPVNYTGINNCNSSDYDPAITGTATASGGNGSFTYSYNDVFVNNSTCFIEIDRTWTATDGNSNSATCVQNIQLDDTQLPVVDNCPNNINLTADANCEAVANWSTITASDNCNGVVSISTSKNSGEVFPIGSTVVNVTATDDCGNSSTCSFTVSVSDTSNPSISGCPSNVIVNSNSNCEAVVNWTPPTVSDNCSGVNMTSTHNSGSIFALGVTTVVYTATDASNNSSTCSFTVEVLNNCTPINITCPANYSDVNNCVSTDYDPINTGTATATGGAGGFTYSHNDVFVNNTSCFVEIDRTWTATDVNGVMATCLQNIQLTDNQIPTIDNCPSDIFLFADSNCEAVANWANILGTDNCGANVSISTSANSGDVFQIGSTLVNVTATDLCNNVNTCSFNVVVTDNTAPVLTACPLNIIVNSDPNCMVVVNWTPPTALDNCSTATITGSHVPGSSFGIGITTVSYTATDTDGNSSTCSFTIDVIDNCSSALTISCPSNFTGQNDCDVSNYDPATTGNATAVGGNGSINITYADNFINNTICLIEIDRTWTATDGDGTTSSCVQNIQLTDTAAPVFDNCPADITLSADPNCEAVGSWASITATDNCTGTVSYGSSHTPSDVFLIGTTAVTYTATDVCGNSTTCTFNIEVIDDTFPVFTACPQNIVVNSDANCVAVVNWVPPVASDNCGHTVSSTHAPGSTFQLGVTTVIYNVVDDSGNAADCLFTVEVIDNCSVPCPVVLNVNVNPIPNNLYEADKVLNSSGLVPANGSVDFHSDLNINLNVGFEVEAGGEFDARIVPCGTAPMIQQENNEIKGN